MTKKLYALIVCIAMLIVSVASVPAHAIAANYVSFTDKIIFENEIYSASDYSTLALNEQEIPESVSVTLRFEESFTCEHESFDNFDQVLEHRAELKEYYSGLNQKLVREFSLTDYESMSFSDYGPFIEYVYPTYDDFMEADYDTLAAKNSAEMTHVYIRSDYPPEECATIGTTTQEYPFSQALSDVGIPTNNTYDGTGIKIGIMETFTPYDMSHLNENQYTRYGNPGTENDYLYDHCDYVSEIIENIATDATFYIAAFNSYSFLQCTNLLIDSGVHVINRSNGGRTGSYTLASAYIDYIVKNTKVTFINSAGNGRSTTNLIDFPSTGVNVISVASNDVDGKISNFSSGLLTEEWRDVLLKPTLTAPGGNLKDIGNFDKSEEASSGTSWSAPIVTGIVALLMEEYPTLKLHPEQVMALLTSSCNDVEGQTGQVDTDAGFGLVNYTRARKICQQYQSGTFVISNNVSSGSVLRNATFVVPANSSATVTATVLYNSTYSTPESSASPSVSDLNFTKVRIAIIDNAAGTTTYGVVKSNFSYATIFNNTSTDKSYTISVRAYTGKTVSTVEYGAFSYYIEGSGHIHSYTHHYTDYSGTQHKSYCSCGDYITASHVYYSEGYSMICQDCAHEIQLAR